MRGRDDGRMLGQAEVVVRRERDDGPTVGRELALRSGGVEVEWSAWLTENLASGEGVAMPLGYPTREQAAVVSPTTPACVPQDHLEPCF